MPRLLREISPRDDPGGTHRLDRRVDDAILAAEAKRGKEALRGGPSEPAMHAMDDIHDRLESPTEGMLRYAGARPSYIVLPLFAFANAGVVIDASVADGHELLMLGIVAASILAAIIGTAVLWRAGRDPARRRSASAAI